MLYRRQPEPTEFQKISELQVPKDLESAYELVRNGLRENNQEVAGWKLGGTNFSSQRSFDTKELFFGPILSGQLNFHPARSLNYNLHQTRVELEIAVRFDPDLSEIVEWAYALEFPSLAVESNQELSLPLLVADHCGAGGLFVGPAHAPADLEAVLASELEMITVQGSYPISGARELTSHPLEVAQKFFGKAQKLGFQVHRNQWIATGGISQCVDFPLGSKISVLAEKQLQFEILVTTPTYGGE